MRTFFHPECFLCRACGVPITEYKEGYQDIYYNNILIPTPMFINVMRITKLREEKNIRSSVNNVDEAHA
ncbi:hypothetical protein K7X08_030917 [Anisodus acutangulus]|uniref:LIM zinc-binding domain-containing protein n=1 Tax=Anisodus acutangulus TaxID=402998 RepID=A0A9Q1M461_9SOLA|nr:hypothetical protein K7X08_030917 [Anisodus acutangulus]